MGTLTRVLSRSGLGAVTVFAGLTCGAAFATWNIAANAGSNALSRSNPAPSTPSAPTAACTAANNVTIKVTFSTVANATSYSVFYSSTANGTYTQMASGVTSSPWTSGSLLAGTYYFEIEAVEGSGWATSNSSASGGHTIGLGTCT